MQKVPVLFMALIIFSANSIFAQCGFTAVTSSACQGFALNLRDTTTGATNTNWSVTLPSGSVPATITLNNSRLFSFNTGTAGVMPGNVCVTMTDMIGGTPCTSTSCNFNIYANPVVRGTLSTTNICKGGCVQWNDASTPGTGCVCSTCPCGMDSFLIDWRNSQPFQPSCTPICEVYNQAGSFHPTILLVNSCGCRADSVLATSIVVTAPPSASFTGANLNSCTSPFTTTITAGSNSPNTRYSWYVSPTGTFSSTPNQATGSNTFTYTYPAGSYSIKLVVLDLLNGCTDSVVQNNYVYAGFNQAACFTASDTSGCAGQISFCPCTNGATFYQWYFSGVPGTFSPDSASYTSAQCTSVSFYVKGYYQAKLIVSYPGGCYDTLVKTNLHYGSPVLVNFSAPDTSFCTVPATVCMTYTGSPCPGCSFRWIPPGSTQPDSPNTCYHLSSFGSFSAQLTVTDSQGCQSQITKSNYVSVAPLHILVNKTYANGNGCANDVIILSDTNSIGGPFASVVWSFPGANVISQNSKVAQVSYSGTGCYNYSVIMTSLSGCADTLRDSICIRPKPVVTMTLSPHDICYEAAPNVFTINCLPNDTPSTVQVWPMGILPPGSPSIIINKDSFSSYSYMYPTYGDFAFCYLASNGGCLGDTTCLTAPADSVHIYPPAPSFNLKADCSTSLTRTFKNQSTGFTSIAWKFNNVSYPTQGDLTVTFPQCGINYPVSITAYNVTTGCQLTKSDSALVPCYGVDFDFAQTKGCYYAYNSQASIFYTRPNALIPTQVLWDVPYPGNPCTFSSTGSPFGSPISYQLYLSGQYDACVQLTYPNGCIDTITKIKYIDISSPLASYSPNATAGCVPFCVNFTNTSVDQGGQIAHFYWSFGDTAGVIDSVHFSPRHCYNLSGVFSACLTIVDTNGCSNTYCKQIQANKIHADFSETDSITCLKNASPLNPVVYSSTSTGIVARYQWLLPDSLGPVPDSVTGNQSTITEQYTRQGYDSICLIAIDQFNVCRDTVCKPIHVANPIANYGLPNGGANVFACPPVPLCLINLAQNNICTYNYLLGDGNTDTAANACHIFDYAGSYPITQIVTSCHGCIDTITKDTIKISGATLTTTVIPMGGCPCTDITWTATSTGANMINFTSDGGNPLFENIPITIGTPANPTITPITITYCNTGNIQPQINVSGSGCNQPNFPIQSIFIDSPNVAFSHTLVNCTDSICFTNLTTFYAPQARDSINKWNFGDGSAIDTARNPCHRFPGPGNYTVTLQVNDQLMCSSIKSVIVHVPFPPVAAFTVTDSSGCLPFLVPFLDSSHVDTSTTMTGYWNFGDGTIANTTADTSHLYTLGSVDIAMLVITDGYGCKDTAKHTITTFGAPNIIIGPNQTICFGDTTTLTASGGISYQWITAYNIQNPTSATPRVWPAVDTCYILQVGSAGGCLIYDTVCVNVSHLTVSLDTAVNTCSNQLTTFTDSAQVTHATISSSIWTFGDGSASASGDSVTHQYATFGNYSDTLIVTSSLGCRDTAVRTVQIFKIPQALFSLSVDTICTGGPVIATNTSTAGSSPLAGFTFYTPPPTSATTSPDTFYPAIAGTETIMLVQTDANQCADTVSHSIYVFSQTAPFNIEYIICPGDIITLQATGSSALWSPNYNISSTTSLTPQVWPAVDTFYALREGTLALCYVYDTVRVFISTMTITADTAMPACLGMPSTFSAMATADSATISSYNWSFGDGTGLTGNPVSHTYAPPYGAHQTTLIVISSRGCHDTAYSTATVWDIPHAALSVSLDSVCLGSPFSVTNLSTPGASIGDSSFYFNFGFPPSAYNTTTAPFIYQTAGIQTITVVVTDSNLCVDSAKAHILVHNLPIADFTPDTSCVNVNNQYISNSTIGDGAITTYSWTVNGLSVSGNQDSINYIFQAPGTETVCLNVKDTFGCQRDTCMSILIVSKPTFTTTYDATICAGSSDTVSITGLVTGAQWVPTTWVSNPNSPVAIVTPLQTVGYQVTVFYHNCTPVVDTVSIWVIDTVPVSASVYPENIVLGLSANVTSTVRGTIDSMVWSPDTSLSCRNCRNPIASPQETTTYTATIYYSKNGVVCSNTATVTVTVFRSCDGSLIYVPNTFTPNNDGIDDVFRLQGQGIVVIDYFRVYDQWGKKVFEAENVADDPYNVGWNGGLNNDLLNKPMNTGVYVYEFQIKCKTGQTVAGKGNITLLK